MVNEFGSEQPSDPLKLEIEESRERLARDVRGLRHEIDIPARIRRSFQQQTTVWVVAAVAVGAAMVFLPRLGKTVYVDGNSKGKGKNRILETGFLLGAVRLAATLLKPAVISFIRNKMAGENGRSARSSSKW
jgi:hypothetical protein